MAREWRDDGWQGSGGRGNGGGRILEEGVSMTVVVRGGVWRAA